MPPLPSRLAAAAFASLLAAPAAAAEPTPPAPTAPAPPAPILLDLGLRIGPSYRLGSAPSFAIAERAGASFGAAVFLAPGRLYAIGLGYEHTGLGTEQGSGDVGSVEIARTLDVLWAQIQVHVLRSEAATLSILLGPGLAWQSATVNGILTIGEGHPPAPLRCSANAAANLGLRVGIGAEIPIGSGVSFLADATVDNLRLSSDLLGDCVPGSGTATLLAARAGFAYRFDVSRFVR